MKLTLDQIRALTVGAVRIAEEPDGWYFYKCTEKQIDAWYAFSDFLGNGASCATGIRLDFHTNSKQLTFATPAKGKYEVFVDNLLCKQIPVGEEDQPAEGEPVTLDLRDPLGNPKDEVRVTLFLPSHSKGALSLLELDDGAYVKKHVFDRKLLMIGDSITQGWNSVYDSFSYAYHVSRFFNADSVIQGIGGSFYHESTFDSLPFEPDAVTVAYGTNDFGHYKTYDELREHVAAYLDLLAKEYAGKPIFVISPIWRAKREGKAMGAFEGCRAVIIEEAEKRGLVHIDGLSLMPAIPELFTDGLHPNALGFGIYGANLVSELNKYLS